MRRILYYFFVFDAEDFRNALGKNHTLMLAVNCLVEYDGRAQSTLGVGDRVIIIKADKSLLVHQPQGSAPINYMKAGSDHSLFEKEGGWILKSCNIPEKEYLTIKIKKVYFFNSTKLEDGKKIELAGSERDMAKMLYKNPEMIEKGFTPLSMEEHTKYGFIDLFGYDKNNVLVVIECKRYIGDPKAVTQLWRYVQKVKASKGLSKVRGMLACPKISPAAKKMLQDFGFKFVKANPPKYLEKHNHGQRGLFDF